VSDNLVCCTSETSLPDVARLMADRDCGDCCAIVSHADIARVASERIVGHVVKEVSRETSMPSRVGVVSRAYS